MKSAPSTQSRRALDLLNVFLADVRDGLGPYLAIYLSTQRWDAGAIGIAMSAMGAAAVAAQTPAGAYIDRTRHKRLAIAAAAIAVGAGCNRDGILADLFGHHLGASGDWHRIGHFRAGDRSGEPRDSWAMRDSPGATGGTRLSIMRATSLPRSSRA